MALAVGSAGSAASAEVEWSYYGAVPAAHSVGSIIVKGFDRIRERTEGRLDISYTFYAETPYKAPEGPTLLRDGLVDLTEWLPAYGAATYPLLTGPELPFASPTYAATEKLFEQAQNSWANETIQSYEKDVLDQHDAVRITRVYYDPMQFWFKEEVSSLKDFSGKKIRAISPEQAELISALGGSPISIPATEVYTALQRGLIDGTIIGSSAIESFKLIEVIKSAYIANLQVLSTGMLASKTSLAAAPEDLRTIFMEEMAAVEKEARGFIVEQEKRDLAKFEKGGMKIVRPSEAEYARLRTLAEDVVWPKWSERAGADSVQFLKEAMGGAGQ